jgi:hypothetical protein
MCITHKHRTRAFLPFVRIFHQFLSLFRPFCIYFPSILVSFPSLFIYFLSICFFFSSTLPRLRLWAKKTSRPLCRWARGSRSCTGRCAHPLSTASTKTLRKSTASPCSTTCVEATLVLTRWQGYVVSDPCCLCSALYYCTTATPHSLCFARFQTRASCVWGILVQTRWLGYVCQIVDVCSIPPCFYGTTTPPSPLHDVFFIPPAHAPQGIEHHPLSTRSSYALPDLTPAFVFSNAHSCRHLIREAAALR